MLSIEIKPIGKDIITIKTDDKLWSYENKTVDLKKRFEVAELIRKDIENNLKKGIKYTGGKVAKLKKSTFTRKGHSRVFYDKDKLFNSVAVKYKGGTHTVYIKTPRTEIAQYLQDGNKLMQPRPFFGITKTKMNEFINKTFTRSRIIRSTNADINTMFRKKIGYSVASAKRKFSSARKLI